MASSNRDWAWLPYDILGSIQEKLIKFTDFVRFCAICSSWRYVALNTNRHDHIHMLKLDILKTCHNQLPLLMTEDKDSNNEYRSFYSIIDEKTYKLQLPMPHNRRCVGSSLGWIFTIEDSMAVSLINPFSGMTLDLPLLQHPSNSYYAHVVSTNTYGYIIDKGILLSDPYLNPNDYGVILIYGDMKDLVFFKSSDKSWTFIKKKERHTIEDVIYYKGKVYAVDAWSELVSIDLTKGEVFVEIERNTTNCCESAYLVESVEGDLLMVHRFVKQIGKEVHEYRTLEFKVFKWSHSVDGKAIWVQIESLGDQAFFLGRNHSISIPTLDFPGCRPNCIYYTDDGYMIYAKYVPRGPDEDTGFFDLEDGSFGTHYIQDPFYKPAMPPIWVVPNLKGT